MGNLHCANWSVSKISDKYEGALSAVPMLDRVKRKLLARKLKGINLVKIGVRASPTEVVYCVFDFERDEVVNVGKICIPKSLGVPEQLKHIRLNLLDVLREYEISEAGIRILEPTAQSISIERVQIEGVIQEAFASSNVKSYYIGQISSIASRVGIERNQFKPLVDGDASFEGFEGWGDLSKTEREATLCAMGA